MGRKVALVLALAMAGACLSVPTAQARTERVCPSALPHAFTDIAGNTHEAAIACLVWREVAFGVTATTYVPAATLTRGQMAAFIVRSLRSAGVAVPAPADQGFTDVAGSVHANEINQLAAIGVTVGTTPTTFDARQELNRGQMAAFLARTYHFTTGERLPVGGHPFTDVAGRTVHADDIARVHGAGITVGATATTYRPHAPVRRDQMASFLVRLLGLLPEAALPDRPTAPALPEPPPAPDPPPDPDPGPAPDPAPGPGPAVPTVCDGANCGWIDGDRVVLATRTVTPFPDDGYVAAAFSMSNYGWAAGLYDVYDHYLSADEFRGDRSTYRIFDARSWRNGYDVLCDVESGRRGHYVVLWFAADCIGSPSQFHVEMGSNHPAADVEPSPSRGTWALFVQQRDAEQPPPPAPLVGDACTDDAAGDVREVATGARVSAPYMDVTEFCVAYDAERVELRTTFVDGQWPTGDDIVVHWDIDTIGDPREARVDFSARYAGGDEASVAYALYPDVCEVGYPHGHYPTEWCWIDIDQGSGYLHLSFASRFLTDSAWPYDGDIPRLRVRMTITNHDRGYVDQAPEGRRWWEEWIEVARPG